MEMIPHLVIDIMKTIKLLLIHKQIFFLTFFHGHNIKITEFPLKYGRETQQKEKEKKMKIWNGRFVNNNDSFIWMDKCTERRISEEAMILLSCDLLLWKWNIIEVNDKNLLTFLGIVLNFVIYLEILKIFFFSYFLIIRTHSTYSGRLHKPPEYDDTFSQSSKIGRSGPTLQLFEIYSKSVSSVSNTL